MQRLDERFDAAVSTLAAAEERLNLAEHDGAQHAQQRNVALCRCVFGNRFFSVQGLSLSTRQRDQYQQSKTAQHA